MLVLSRKVEETIIIDGQIEIQVIRVEGNRVKLGIRAPQNVKILRSELAPFGKESDSSSTKNISDEMPLIDTFADAKQYLASHVA